MRTQNCINVNSGNIGSITLLHLSSDIMPVQKTIKWGKQFDQSKQWKDPDTQKAE